MLYQLFIIIVSPTRRFHSFIFIPLSQKKKTSHKPKDKKTLALCLCPLTSYTCRRKGVNFGLVIKLSFQESP